MNPTLHAVRVGMERGMAEFRANLRSPSDMSFYLVMSAAIVVSLFFQRNRMVEGTDISFATLALPSTLGAMVGFLGMLGAAYSLATEREDGTLLRAKAVPNGMVGYFSGQILRASLEALMGLVVVLIPGLLLFSGLSTTGLLDWLTLLWVLVLGLLASLPIGIVVGSVVRGTRGVQTWGMIPIMALVGLSGIFYPLTSLPEWLQVIAQVFPIYWLGLGMRSALLPDAAVVVEIGESWRQLEAVGVLSAWAIVGLLVAPVVLRRMARRESGSAMQRRREEVLRRSA